MAQTISKDGTRIAFEKTGKGPALIIVNGAMGFRAFYGDKHLANLLSTDFTVYLYDRRGRGESTDAKQYSVEREIEDIESLIDDAGGSAFLYGVSSGAALVLLSAAKLSEVKIPSITLYEPPYSSDSDQQEKAKFAKQKKQLNQLVKGGKRGDAVAFFISTLGTPPDMIESMQHSSDWPFMESVEHTLAYDYEILGDGAIPVDVAAKVTMPALVMCGDKSFDFMQETATKLSKALPNAKLKILKDQTHQVEADVLAPVLKEFFEHKFVKAG